MQRVDDSALHLFGEDCLKGARLLRDLIRSMPRERLLSEWERQFVAEVQAMGDDYASMRVSGAMSADGTRTSPDLHVGPVGHGRDGTGDTVELVTTAEVARLLDVSTRHANRLRRERRWACRKQNGCWLIDAGDVQDYLEARSEDR